VQKALIGLQRDFGSLYDFCLPNKSLVACHNHPSPVDLIEAIRNSCNPYYHQAFSTDYLIKKVLQHFFRYQNRTEYWRKELQKNWWSLASASASICCIGESGGSIPSGAYYD